MRTATYQRDKKLRIRKAPSTDAKIVGYMQPNEPVEVLEVEDGWCKTADGFIMESLVAIADDGDEANDDEPPASDDGAADDGTTDGETEKPADDGDEANELRKMTNPQLYELCEKSGIKVKKNASKETMIAALLNPDA